MAQDRRRFQRVGLDSPVRVLLDQRENGFVLDVCEDGLAVCELGARTPGEIVPFVFDLPDESGCVQGKAEIIWKSASGRRSGLHFVEMDDPCRQRLVQWISSQAWTMRVDGVEKDQQAPVEVARPAESQESPIFVDGAGEGERTVMLASAGGPAATGEFTSERAAPPSGDQLWGALANEPRSMRAAGVALVAVLLSVTLGFLLYHSRGTRASARAKDNPVPAAQVAAATPEEPAAQAMTAGAVAAMPVAPAPTPPARNRVAAAGTVVQVGAMTHQAYADALVKELQQKNLPAFVFHREGDNFYRVAVGPFTDSESPARVKGQLEKQGLKPFVRPWVPNQH